LSGTAELSPANSSSLNYAPQIPLWFNYGAAFGCSPSVVEGEVIFQGRPIDAAFFHPIEAAAVQAYLSSKPQAGIQAWCKQHESSSALSSGTLSDSGKAVIDRRQSQQFSMIMGRTEFDMSGPPTLSSGFLEGK
jgi:hypothetical protein